MLRTSRRLSKVFEHAAFFESGSCSIRKRNKFIYLLCVSFLKLHVYPFGRTEKDQDEVSEKEEADKEKDQRQKEEPAENGEDEIEEENEEEKRKREAAEKRARMTLDERMEEFRQMLLDKGVRSLSKIFISVQPRSELIQAELLP